MEPTQDLDSLVQRLVDAISSGDVMAGIMMAIAIVVAVIAVWMKRKPKPVEPPPEKKEP